MTSKNSFKWAVAVLFPNDGLFESQYSHIFNKDNPIGFGLYIDDILIGTFEFGEHKQLQFKPITDIIWNDEIVEPIPLSVSICRKILKPTNPYLTKYIKKRELVTKEVDAINELYELYIYTLMFINHKYSLLDLNS